MTRSFVLSVLIALLSNVLTGELASSSSGSHHHAAAQSLVQQSVLNACKTEYGRYTDEQLNKLADVLAYDNGPAAMNVDIMKSKVQKLVATEKYETLKLLLKDCADFHDSEIVGANTAKRSALRARLRRSLIILYDNREDKRFSEVIVMMIGTP